MSVKQDAPQRPAPATDTPVVPLEIDQLDLRWLGHVLRGKDIRQVVNIECEKVIWGTATKVLMRLDVEAPAGATRSLRICVKGPFDATLRQYYDLGIMFVLEAAFYRDVAPLLDVRLPLCHHAAEDGAYGIVILEDMVAAGCTFASPERAATPEQASSVLEVMAGVHRGTSGWKEGRFPWLRLGSVSGRVGIMAMGEGDRFQDLCARPEVASALLDGYRDKNRVMSALRKLWDKDDARSDLVLGHGDAHFGQVYFDAQGKAGLLDWQSIGMMPMMKDVAYFLGGALTVEDRRRHERELLAGYLNAVARNGGPVVDLEAAWQDYCAQMLQGIVWALVTEKMQSSEIIAAFNERYGAAMSDLGALERAEA